MLNKYLKINILIIVLSISFLSLFQYFQYFEDEYFRTGSFITINDVSGNKTNDQIISDTEQVAKDYGVMIHYFQKGDDDQSIYYISNLDDYTDQDYLTNDLIDIGESTYINYPNVIDNIYIYDLNQIENINIEEATLVVNSEDSNTLNQMIESFKQSGYDATLTDSYFLPNNNEILKLIIIIEILLFMIFINIYIQTSKEN